MSLEVMDRRLSVTTLPNEDDAVYSLLRAWVQDDPTRQAPEPGRHQRREGITLPNPCNETADSLVRLQVKRRHESVETILGLESLQTREGAELPTNKPSPDALLREHISHLKSVRKWWQRRCEHRRKRFRPRLEALGVPIGKSSGRLAMAATEEEEEEEEEDGVNEEKKKKELCDEGPDGKRAEEIGVTPQQEKAIVSSSASCTTIVVGAEDETQLKTTDHRDSATD